MVDVEGRNDRPVCTRRGGCEPLTFYVRPYYIGHNVRRYARAAAPTVVIRNFYPGLVFSHGARTRTHGSEQCINDSIIIVRKQFVLLQPTHGRGVYFART